MFDGLGSPQEWCSKKYSVLEPDTESQRSFVGLQNQRPRFHAWIDSIHFTRMYTYIYILYIYLSIYLSIYLYIYIQLGYTSHRGRTYMKFWSLYNFWWFRFRKCIRVALKRADHPGIGGHVAWNPGKPVYVGQKLYEKGWAHVKPNHWYNSYQFCCIVKVPTILLVLLR